MWRGSVPPGEWNWIELNMLPVLNAKSYDGDRALEAWSMESGQHIALLDSVNKPWKVSLMEGDLYVALELG